MPSAQRVNWAKFRVLAVAAASSLILGTISYLLTGGTIFEPKATLYLYMDDATGLVAGSPVRVDGIIVGKVDTVELSGSNDPQRVVRVSVKVDRDRLDAITVDSTAQTSTDSPIGDKYVDITSGVSPQHLLPGAEITFKSSPDLMRSIDLATFQKKIHEIELLLDDVEQGRSPLGKFIAGDEFYTQLNNKIRALQQSIHAAADTTTAVGQALYTDQLYREAMEPLRKLDESLAKLQSGQGSMGQALRDPQQYASALAQMGELRNSIAGIRRADMMHSDQMHRDLSRQVDTMIQAVDAFNAGPLLTTSAVYDNLTGMAREVQGTMKDFRENPKKFLRLKLF